MPSPFTSFIQNYSGDSPISTESLQAIEQSLKVVKLKKNHILIREGEPHPFAYYVVKGAVRSFYLKEQVEVSTWFAFEDELVGTLKSYHNQPSRETMQLLENCTLISINLPALSQLVLTNLEISNFIAAIVTEYAEFLEDRLYYSAFTSSMERYVNLLHNEPEVFQRVPLTYIASYLGISRETLSRLRSR